MTKATLPILKENIGKRGTLNVPPDKHILRYTIKDETRLSQTGMPEKILCLQLIEFEDGRMEVRTCYYIIGKKPRMLGRWVFGQFTAMMPLADFRKLVRQAEDKDWFDL